MCHVSPLNIINSCTLNCLSSPISQHTHTAASETARCGSTSTTRSQAHEVSPSPPLDDTPYYTSSPFPLFLIYLHFFPPSPSPTATTATLTFHVSGFHLLFCTPPFSHSCLHAWPFVNFMTSFVYISWPLSPFLPPIILTILQIPLPYSCVRSLYVLTVLSLPSTITGTARFTKQGKGESKGAGFEGGSIRYALADRKG